MNKWTCVVEQQRNRVDRIRTIVITKLTTVENNVVKIVEQKYHDDRDMNGV